MGHRQQMIPLFTFWYGTPWAYFYMHMEELEVPSEYIMYMLADFRIYGRWYGTYAWDIRVSDLFTLRLVVARISILISLFCMHDF